LGGSSFDVDLMGKAGRVRLECTVAQRPRPGSSCAREIGSAGGSSDARGKAWSRRVREHCVQGKDTHLSSALLCDLAARWSVVSYLLQTPWQKPALFVL
jgi:hypothetical protein